MIGYEDMPYNDAGNYFGGCWCFEWDAEVREVTPWRMQFLEEYDGYESAHDCEIRLVSGNDYIRVTGEELWVGDRFITHRFGVEYVPINHQRIARVSLEPHERRMLKGMYTGYARYYTLLDIANSRHEVRVNADRISDAALFRGVAQVLQIGTPPVMRRRIDRALAESRSRNNVTIFMATPAHNVMVPEFNWAVIKHRTYPRWAYVLRSGKHVGYVKLPKGTDTPTFLGCKSEIDDRKTRTLINNNLMEDARRLLCESVDWATGNPVTGGLDEYDISR